MSSDVVLQVSDLAFGYPGEAPMFNRWSATLGPGLHRLEGESGSGKSTLQSVLAGELASQGRRLLNGLDANADPAAWRRAV